MSFRAARSLYPHLFEPDAIIINDHYDKYDNIVPGHEITVRSFLDRGLLTQGRPTTLHFQALVGHDQPD